MFKKSRFISICFFTAILLCGCSGQDSQEFTSPESTNTIIVEYDFVSRPTIYKKTWYGKSKIWQYEGTGFMETVYFDVEWLSEDEILVSYDDSNDKYDEEFTITIPE